MVALGTGLSIGLPRAIDALRVGLDAAFPGRVKEMGYEPVMVGDDAAELTVDPGTLTGIEMGSLGLLRLIGEPMTEWDSRRYDIDGDTARRLEAFA